MTDDRSTDKNYVFYEVNLKINAEIIFEYDEWLKDHVQEMLSLPGFVSASVDIPERTMTVYQYRTVKFRLDSKQALDNYFSKYAEKMRAVALDKFRGRFTVSRKVYVIPIENATEAYAEQLEKKS